jgi:putative addiction module killer protein
MSSNDYDHWMCTIKQTPEFAAWLSGIKDRLMRQCLATRLRKASFGNIGDVKPVGSGVFEMRESFGPGWRLLISELPKLTEFPDASLEKGAH